GRVFWPTGKPGPAALADAAGVVEMDVAELALPGGQVAKDTRFGLRLGAGAASLENLHGEIAGGKFDGHASFVRGESIAFDGRIAVKNFDVGQMISRGEGAAPVRGRGTLTLSLAGSGVSPAALAESLAGQGTLALERLEVDRADPKAV